MAKKREYSATVEYTVRPIPDNNPDGPSPLPDDRLNANPSGTMNFSDMVAEGESPFKPDVNTVTANGISKSRGQGDNCQYNYWEGNSGIWNKNRDWKGGNLTGC